MWVTWNFTLQSTPWENAKLKCSEISTLQNREIKMQLKYSVLQYLLHLMRNKVYIQTIKRTPGVRHEVQGCEYTCYKVEHRSRSSCPMTSRQHHATGGLWPAWRGLSMSRQSDNNGCVFYSRHWSKIACYADVQRSRRMIVYTRGWPWWMHSDNKKDPTCQTRGQRAWEHVLKGHKWVKVTCDWLWRVKSPWEARNMGEKWIQKTPILPTHCGVTVKIRGWPKLPLLAKVTPVYGICF